MKYFFFSLLVTSLFSLQSCKGKATEFSKLQNRDGVFYTVNSKTPFTGKVVENYYNGQKKIEGSLKDGKPIGKLITWYDNGQKESEINYNSNKYMAWYKNGKEWLLYKGSYSKKDITKTFNYWEENKQKLIKIFLIKKTKTDLLNIKKALLKSSGKYSGPEGLPRSLNELVPAHLDEQPEDPWGNDYVYNVPGKYGKKYTLYSKGPDGLYGTGDDVFLKE